MSGLESIYARLVGLEITGEMWVDGSFLTQKVEPEDVDLVVFASARFFESGTPQQVEFINWLADKKDDVKALFSCHSHAIAQYNSPSHMYVLYAATRNEFENLFGHSVATREPKGIVTIALEIPKKVEAAK